MISPLQKKLDELAEKYQQPEYIEYDPIAIPHAFDSSLDREIVGLVSALLAWGRRQTILDKMHDFCRRIDYRPASFLTHFDNTEAHQRLDGFKHRTFSSDDAFWLCRNLSLLLSRHGSLEQCFARHGSGSENIGEAIEGFSTELLAIDPDTPARLKKHVARPSTGSACKRLCMFVRWMVRPGPFDFGQWNAFTPAQLVLPLDVHSGTQARKFGMLERKNNDWKAAMELTRACREMDPSDPCKYDFAFFGSGVYGLG